MNIVSVLKTCEHYNQKIKALHYTQQSQLLSKMKHVGNAFCSLPNHLK